MLILSKKLVRLLIVTKNCKKARSINFYTVQYYSEINKSAPVHLKIIGFRILLFFSFLNFSILFRFLLERVISLKTQLNGHNSQNIKEDQ